MHDQKNREKELEMRFYGLPRAAIRFALTLAVLLASSAMAQQPAAPATQPGRGARGGRGPQGPVVVSPEVLQDRRVTFRILAPSAENVRLNAGDIPGGGRAA